MLRMSSIGIAYEIAMRCPHCSNGLPLNALVDRVVCGRCAGTVELEADDWLSLLEDGLDEGPSRETGSGGSATIFSSHQYDVLWARFDPYFWESKQDIDPAVLPAAAERGYLEDPSGGLPVSVRRLPAEYADTFPGVIYLISEDFGQLPAGVAPADIPLEDAPEPQAFLCPHCGSALRVEGDNRTVQCQYCDGSSLLPDEIWFRLHPVSTKKRWFLVLDEGQRPLGWEDDVLDAVSDGHQRTFVAVESGSDVDVVCVGPDRCVRWRRPRLLKEPPDRSHLRLALTGDGWLMVFHPSRKAVRFLSREDGTTVDQLGGKKGRHPAEGTFSARGCRSMAPDLRDGSLWAWAPSATPDDDGDETWELVHFDGEGARLPTWSARTVETDPLEPPPKEGFFARLGKLFGAGADAVQQSLGDARTPWFDALRDRPERCREENVQVGVAGDGSVLLWHDKYLARYTADGDRCYLVELDCYRIHGCVHGLPDGAALALCERRDDSGTYVAQIPPSGGQPTHLREHVRAGGPVGEEDQALAVAPDGTVQVFGYDTAWRIIAPDGSLVFCSKTSAECEEEVAEEDGDSDDDDDWDDE